MARKISFWVAFLVFCLSFAYSQDAGSAAKTAPLVTLAPWVLHAKLIHEVAPEYPAFARENHIQGDAFVDVIVDENGKVQKAAWIECANCSSVLGEAAVKAVTQWEYQPVLLDGNPVQVGSWIALRFHLDDGASVEVLSKSESSTPAAKPSRVPTPVAIPQKLRISSGVAAGNLLHKVDPEYPQEAKAAQIQGDVVLQCLINKEGNVINLRVVSGHPLLANAAMDVVKQWRYKPYLLNGNPVEVETTVTVRFRM